MARRKYHAGDVLTYQGIFDEIMAGNPVMLHGKPQNAKWLMNMSLTTLFSFVRAGVAQRAILDFPQKELLDVK